MSYTTEPGATYALNQATIGKTDEDCTLNSYVHSIDALAACTVTLCGVNAQPRLGDRHRVNAVGGTVTVLGGLYPILGSGIVPQGSAAEYELASAVGGGLIWVEMGGGNALGIGEIFVADLDALFALPTAGLPDRIYARVLTLDQPFELIKGSALTPDWIPGQTTSASIVEASDGGNWLRRLIHAPVWSDQHEWFQRDDGDDQNDGTQATQGAGRVGPIKTLSEWSRRVKMMNPPPATPAGTGYPRYVIDTDGVTIADEYRASALIDSDFSGNNVFQVLIKGNPVVAESGTVGADGVVAADPATDTPSIFDGGVGFVPADNIGKMIRMAGPNGATRAAWILADAALAGGTRAYITSLYDTNTTSATIADPDTTPASLTPFQAARVNDGAQPVAGAAYEIVDLTPFAPGYFGIGAAVMRTRLMYLDLTPNDAAGNFIQCRDSTITLNMCKAQRPFSSSFGGAITSQVCGIIFPALADFHVFGPNAMVGNGYLNVRMKPIGVGGSSGNDYVDCYMEASTIQTLETVGAVPTFGGAAGAAATGGGLFTVSGGKGLGIRNAPAGLDAIRMVRGATAQIGGDLWGSGGDQRGVDISEGSTMRIISTVTPTLTGTLGDFRLDGVDTHYQDLRLFSDAWGQAAAPATHQPLLVTATTWAGWAAAVVNNTSGFERNLVSTRAGSKIISFAAT